MNPGGEPERDDTGLPPVEIEIPDDARELDRDVQAYYREQRAQRRRQRRLRLHGSLAKDSIVLPLLACFLILALITGTLLTIFSATSDQNLTGVPGSGKTAAKPGPSSRARPGTAASATAGASSATSGGSAGATNPVTVATERPAPQATIAVGSQGRMPVRALKQAVLVLIPRRCGCAATVSWLTGVAANAHAGIYLIYTADTKAEVTQLYGQLGSQVRTKAYLALETDGILQQSAPAGLSTSGLTAILVGRRQLATYATGLSSADDSSKLTQALTR